MPKQVVMIVCEWDAATPEEAEQQARETQERYEGEHWVFAASELSGLPHPMQISSLSEHFGG